MKTLHDQAGRRIVGAAEISAARGDVIVLGIDPGLHGALAFINNSGIVALCDMPTVEVLRGGKRKRDIRAPELAHLLNLRRPDHAFIELVHAMPKQGVSSTFSFGKGVGVLDGVLAALEIPVIKVSPQVWQRDMCVRGKDAARARAAELFPRDAKLFSRAKDDGRADAALIAAWGLRHGGIL